MYITAIDLGSSQIKILVAELNKENQLSLVDVLQLPSNGIKKGEISDLQEIIKILSHIFEEISRISKNALKNIFVNVGGKNIKLQTSKGIIAVSRADNEIYQDDIDRAIKASQAINLTANRKIVHTIIQEYVIDGIDQIQNPLGMHGARLEVNSVIVDAFTPVMNDIYKAIGSNGGDISEMVYNPLAVSNSALSKTHKELGTVAVDIGFGTTSISVFEENKLVSAKVFPIGASNITNDLAIALKCSIDVAEKIKIGHGHALSKEVSLKEKIDLRKFDPGLKSIVSKKFVSDIIEVRLAEIFELIHNELKSIGKTRLPAGVILCGGGAKMEGIADLAKQELKLPVHLAHLESDNFDSLNHDLSSKSEELEFAVACGLLSYGSSRLTEENKLSGWMSGKGVFLSRILKNLIP
ncbi:MAG: cell division protein FtsA [Patescibacteria group bacterium]|nr:cell division protein FtsA [Patescibacteria group bacterium]